MFNVIMRLFLMIIILIGVIFIYDARSITRSFFGFGDQNEGTLGMKIIGFLFAILGGIMLYFLCKYNG